MTTPLTSSHRCDRWVFRAALVATQMHPLGPDRRCGAVAAPYTACMLPAHLCLSPQV